MPGLACFLTGIGADRDTEAAADAKLDAAALPPGDDHAHSLEH
jgi:hypothetical protein